MAKEPETTPEGAAAATGATASGNGKAPRLNVLTQYVKDLSFESPGAPMSLRPREKAPAINKMSYLNHQILLQKNFSNDFSMATKNATDWYNIKSFFYLLIFEPKTLGQWWKVLQLRRRITTQRKAMPRRVSHLEIEKLMES